MNLQELIASTRGDSSYEDLSKRSGGEITHTRWWQLAAGSIKTAPGPDAIKVVARTLGVTERQVWLAVGETLGLAVGSGESRLHTLLPGGTESLSDEQVGVLLSMARILIQQQREAAQAAAEAASLDDGVPEAPARARRR